MEAYAKRDGFAAPVKLNLIFIYLFPGGWWGLPAVQGRGQDGERESSVELYHIASCLVVHKGCINDVLLVRLVL